MSSNLRIEYILYNVKDLEFFDIDPDPVPYYASYGSFLLPGCFNKEYHHNDQTPCWGRYPRFSWSLICRQQQHNYMMTSCAHFILIVIGSEKTNYNGIS